MNKWLLVLAACSKGPAHPAVEEPHLVASSELHWYRTTSTCAQGPFELELAATGAKYGEVAELELHTPRPVQLDAIVLVDGREVDRAHGVYDANGTTAAKPANTRCLADAKERLVLARPGGPGGATPGTPATPGTLVPEQPIAPNLPLEPIRDGLTTSSSVITFHIPQTTTGRITIRFWSIEPNDLGDVAFGLGHVTMRPNIPEADYDAYLVREQHRFDPPRPRPMSAEELARRDRERAAELERARAEEARAAIEAERARRHEQYCNTHHDDRDCWGPGGFAGHAELELRERERAAYCAKATEDARCWDPAEWGQRRSAWNARVDKLTAAPPRPSGPPPAPLADPEPPQPSTHAAWRPGYWEWTEGQWVWLAGMWRVPDEDIAAEQTATAPAEPPPPQAEQPPPPPVHAVVWVPGYWMWNGSGWIWIAGSYQLRPEPRLEWRAPAWRVRGPVHVLVPGGWVRR